MLVKLPANKMKNPISRLIEELQKLPEGTTYEETSEDGMLYGGEVPEMELGTSYRRVIDITEGFDPPRF